MNELPHYLADEAALAAFLSAFEVPDLLKASGRMQRISLWLLFICGGMVTVC